MHHASACKTASLLSSLILCQECSSAKPKLRAGPSARSVLDEPELRKAYKSMFRHSSQSCGASHKACCNSYFFWGRTKPWTRRVSGAPGLTERSDHAQRRPTGGVAWFLFGKRTHPNRKTMEDLQTPPNTSIWCLRFQKHRTRTGWKRFVILVFTQELEQQST